jgi:hypothetical protein
MPRVPQYDPDRGKEVCFLRESHRQCGDRQISRIRAESAMGVLRDSSLLMSR